jgi:hypothetical protein
MGYHIGGVQFGYGVSHRRKHPFPRCPALQRHMWHIGSGTRSQHTWHIGSGTHSPHMLSTGCGCLLILGFCNSFVHCLQNVKAGEPIVSGAYQLMALGRVTPLHRDHPANRQLCEVAGCSTEWPGHAGQQDLVDYIFTASGLQLESAHYKVHKRCVWASGVVGVDAKGVVVLRLLAGALVGQCLPTGCKSIA